MALPFIILGVAAAATAFGGKKAYDGYQKKSEADDVLARAQRRFETHKKSFDAANELSTTRLNELGGKELAIGQNFNDFSVLVKDMLARMERDGHKDIKLSIPQHSINKIQNLAISANEYLTTVVGAGVSGAAAGFAVYSGVMAFAAASTGTPIAALSGAAAYNATMAAIGGGSLAAGGWGMAGGAMVLGGAVVAPLIAIAGWAYDSHAEKALNNANESSREVDTAVEKMSAAEEHLTNVQQYVDRIYVSITRMNDTFTEYYFSPLKAMHARIVECQDNNISDESDDIITLIENGYKLAAIMTDVITTPLFKPVTQENGEVLIEDGVIQLQTTNSGMNMLNKEELDAALQTSESKFAEFAFNF
ncbi:chemotaxis protein [Lelliottia amnigena]|uniref:Chemotaxis protein n=1 Tax=Lelliottia amnigena TaxID=61646 RepID=A0AAP2AHX3_LELAM|nr:chemotaxis protein [Lelliottia amnigena]MBL5901180.1 chemotaxis protein [Lelliottia amnigena]MBL5936579.1 chemotaxis protein [Lelliottia amnigena]